MHGHAPSRSCGRLCNPVRKTESPHQCTNTSSRDFCAQLNGFPVAARTRRDGGICRALQLSDIFGSETEDRTDTVEGVSTNKTTWGAKLAEKSTLPPISKTDEEFLDEGIEFVEGTDDISLEELNDLFAKVGFPRRNLDKLRLALDNTHCVLWIRYTRKSRWAKMGQLLGFARAMSDGVFSASIWDVAVLPAWQRSGLGRGLMERLLVRLREDNINTITLYAEPNVVGLYEKLGFLKDPEGIKGMAFQKRSKIGRRVAANQNN